MQKLECDGCGRRELLSISEEDRTIKPVKLNVVNETSTWHSAGTDEYDADLCETCRSILLSKYFRINREVDPDIDLPSFFEMEIRN